jgi:hypothetical protein
VTDSAQIPPAVTTPPPEGGCTGSAAESAQGDAGRHERVGGRWPRNPVEGMWALVCLGVGNNFSAEWTYWPTREEAQEADRELSPCSERCTFSHTIVRVPREEANRTTAAANARWERWRETQHTKTEGTEHDST